MELKKLNEELVKIRRAIHSMPELGNLEYITTRLIKKYLYKYGLQVLKSPGSGAIAVLEGKKAGGRQQALLLRADIDALPIEEKTGKSYASKHKGVMHACGHDANTAIMLGAAKLLAGEVDNFSGRIKFVFQPNEESSGGAALMISRGVMRNPRVDACLGLHVSPWLKPGQLGIREGQMMASVDRFEIEVLAEQTHGAYPHLGKDAIVIASMLVTSLQSIVSREIDPVEPCVITVGSIRGGDAFNVIAGSCKITGTVRTLSEKIHKGMPKLLERKARAITGAYGASYKMKYEVLGHPLVNAKKILEPAKLAAQNVYGKHNVISIKNPSMGGEDFAEYLRYAPGCFVFVGSAPEKVFPWHSDHFDIDESILGPAAGFVAEFAKTYLK